MQLQAAVGKSVHSVVAGQDVGAEQGLRAAFGEVAPARDLLASVQPLR